MNDRRGFILIISFVFMVMLTVMVGAFLYMISAEIKGSGYQDYALLSIAEAGAQRALREIRDEVLSVTPTIGVADLSGATTSGTAGGGMPRVRYYNESSPNILIMDATSAAGTTVILQDYDLNYLESTDTTIAGSVIKNVKIGCCYKKTSGGGSTPRLEILYTTNGTFPQAGNSSFDVAVTSTSYNASPFVVLDITNDRNPWMWSLINSSNFQIRARAYTPDAPRNRDADIDYLFLQVTYEIDTLKEKWADGTYASFPIVLGSGKMQSVSITDEQRKVHLNTASDSLLINLMTRCGITSPSPSTIVSNLRTYLAGKASHAFDSVEELQQVTGMSATNYNYIKDYVTVYSFITPNAQRPAGSRAPVNINTAPLQVLEALYDDAALLGSALSATFAADIIATRNTSPFTCFYTVDSTITTDFYDFVNTRGYLSAAQKNIVLDNADSSLLVPVAGYAGSNAVTTEFCYCTTAFKIDSLADSNPDPVTQGRRFRVKTILGYDGNRTFPTYSGDATPVGYRVENYE